MSLFSYTVDLNRKRDFVLSNTEVMAIARKTADEASQKKSTIHYYLFTEQSHIKVCKNLLLSTLGVGQCLFTGQSRMHRAHGRQIP